MALLVTQDNIEEFVGNIIEGTQAFVNMADVLTKARTRKSILGVEIETPFGLGECISTGNGQNGVVLRVRIGDKTAECNTKYGWRLIGDETDQKQLASSVANIVPLPAVADRPVCEYCQKTLLPYLVFHEHLSPGQRFKGNQRIIGIKRTKAYNGDPFRWEVSIWAGEGRWGYEGNDLFCTLRCGSDFARAAHNAGYRIIRGGTPT